MCTQWGRTDTLVHTAMASLKSSIVEDAIKFQVKAHVSESDGDKLEARQCDVVTEKQENLSLIPL